MLKKILPLVALAFILISTPALASQNKNTQANTVSGCDKEDEWESHGAYVSCVARLKLGGKVTSQAAHSDVGKEHDDRDDDEENDDEENEDEENSSPTPTPTPSPTVSPSVSPSPTIDPSTTPSPSPTSTSEEVIQENINLIGQLIDTLKDMIKNLEDLLS